MSNNASFESERIMRLKLSQLPGLLTSASSDRPHTPRRVAKSIIVVFSDTQTQTMVCWCRENVNFRIGVGHPWWRRPLATYLLPTSLWLNIIFLLVHSHFARTMTNIALYFAVLNHLSWVLFSTVIGSLLQKTDISNAVFSDWINCCDVTRHGLSSDARSTQISS